MSSGGWLVRQLLRAVAGVAVVVLVIAGMPWLLLALTRRVLADPPDLAALVDEPLSAATVVLLALAGAWMFWGWLLVGGVLGAVDRVRRPDRRRLRPPAPLHASVGAVVGAVGLLLDGFAVHAAVDARPAAGNSPAATSPHSAGPRTARAGAPAQGVDVGASGWLPLPAVAAGAVAAVIWSQRRRMYQPRPPRGAWRDDPDLTPLPAPSGVDGRVTIGVTVGGAVTGWLDLTDLPAGGVRLSGAGAASAVRGLLVAVLAAAGSDSGPAAVIAAGDLRSLFGAMVVDVPGLHVVDGRHTAAATCVELAEAGRQVLAVGGRDGHLEPGPDGVTVVAVAADPSLPSWDVRTDGTVSAAAVRLAVLDAAAAAIILAGLHRHPSAELSPPQVEPPQPVPQPLALEPVAAAARTRQLQIAVLGPVHIAVRTGDVAGTPVSVRRTAGLHLLILLAVHRGGATGDDLAAALWPGQPAHTVSRRLATTVHELRQELRSAAGSDVVQRYTVLTGGSGYRLDPAHVDVDLWRFHDLLDTADSVPTQSVRRELLHEAAGLDRGELAEGQASAWLDPVRESTARHRIDVLTYLADAEPDHGAALALLHRALRIAPDNEAVVRAVLRRHAVAGDLDGVHRAYDTLLRQLAPQPATTLLFDELTTTDPGVTESAAAERNPR
ncbi:hypothetical protein [Dactylosporangium sp. NPDC005555]|uniref:AfsR/SARP family transcriptional regulator n=1 Tax=Dactylosporangium sp. NPDC005555 TaxID=3154889 RepID=UPI00339E53F9